METNNVTFFNKAVEKHSQTDFLFYLQNDCSIKPKLNENYDALQANVALFQKEPQSAMKLFS
jgi:hypothetical protein